MDEAIPFAVRKRLRLVPFNEIDLPGECRYLVKDLIPAEGLTVIWGPPKCGKSFLAFDLAMHVALGWEWRDRRIKQGPVVYCACEGASGIRARAEAFRRERMSDDQTDVPFYLQDVTLDLISDHRDLIETICATLGDIPPALVVIDTLNRSLRGSENNDQDMGEYIRAADVIREAFQCAVAIVHHCGIEGTRPRGHTSLTGAADAQIAIKRTATDAIVATVEFMKDGPEGDEYTSRLRVVELGDDDDGDTLTSCVVEPAEPDTMTTRGHRVTGNAKIALDQLTNALIDHAEQPPENNHIPRTNKVVRVDLWQGFYVAASGHGPDNLETAKRGFRRAKENLQASNIIGVWEGYVWIN